MQYVTYFFSVTLVAVLAAFTFTTDNPASVTVQGNLVDTLCYGDAVNMDMPEAGYNDDHMVPGPDGEMMEIPNCATACANMGIPVGVNEGDAPGGQTYILVTPATQLSDYMDQEVRVEGTRVFEGGIKPNTIEVKEDGEWKEVEIQLMM